MQSRFVVAAASLALAACSGGGSSSPAVPAASATASAPLAPQADVTPRFQLSGESALSTVREPSYLPRSSRSIAIRLLTVDGAAPAPGAKTVLTTNLTGCAGRCDVDGPPAPAGTDTFSVRAYDAPDGKGHALAEATPTVVITAGRPIDVPIRLLGIPASFALGALPAAAAGLPFAAPQPVQVIVKDADGNPIAGRYASTVWIDDLDPSGASTFLAAGADAPPPGRLFSSTDTVALAYDGLAMAPTTLMVSALNATTLRASFAPAVNPIAYQGPTAAAGAPQIDLFAPAGAGSAVTFSVAEKGWTDAPFAKPFRALLGAGCANVATVTPAAGTSFTVHAAAAPAAGTCALTLVDGAGQARVVTVTYATTALSAN